MGYLTIPVTTDPTALAKTALQYLQTNIPGWTPTDGNLEVWLIYALAQILSISRDVASVVPDQIFQYFGGSIMGLPAIAASPATVIATFTVQDNAGYTIPSGTQVAFQVTGSTIQIFVTTADVVIAPGGATAVGVVLTAQVAGSAANNLTGAMIMVDPLAFVTSVVATSTSSGGIDAETSATYLSRLTAELQLMAPRPILPNDFAVLARSVSGVYRAIGIDGYNAARTFTDGAVVNGSNLLNSAAVAKFVQADVGRVVTDAGGAIPGATTILQVNSATQAVMSNNATGTNAADTVTLAAMTAQQRTVGVSAVDANGVGVSGTVQAAVMAYLQAQREVNFVVTYVAPSVTTVNVVFAIKCLATAVASAVVSACVTAVQNYLSQANWGGGNLNPPQWDPTATVVRYLQLAAVIENVPGVGYISSLTLNGAAADVALAGIAPLAAAGTVTGSSI